MFAISRIQFQGFKSFYFQLIDANNTCINCLKIKSSKNMYRYICLDLKTTKSYAKQYFSICQKRFYKVSSIIFLI